MNIEELQTIKNEGNQQFKEKKFQKAIFTYEKCLEKIQTLKKDEQKNQEVQNLSCILYTNIAICEYQLQNFEDCIEPAQKALEIQPEKFKARYHLCLAYWKQIPDEDEEEEGKKPLTIKEKRDYILKAIIEGKKYKLNKQEIACNLQILREIYPDYKTEMKTMIEVLKNEKILKISEVFVLEVCDLLDRYTIDREMEGKNYVDSFGSDSPEVMAQNQLKMIELGARNQKYLTRQREFVENGGKDVVKNLEKIKNKNQKLDYFIKEFNLTVMAVVDPNNQQMQQKSYEESKERFLKDAMKMQKENPKLKGKVPVYIPMNKFM